MSKGKYNYLLIIFLFSALINLFAEYQDNSLLVLVSKPLLLTLLALYFHLNTKYNKSAFRKFLLLGLVFSIAGDSFLMFVENPPAREEFFLLGLGSFLLTHIFYSLAFFKYPNVSAGLIQQKKWLLIPFLLFLFGNTLFLWPDLSSALKIPVFLYSLAIVLMVLSCTNLYGQVPYSIFKLIFIGAILFLISDSLIGLNKFKSGQLSLWQPRLLIMFSYILGQWLITIGAVQLVHNLKSKNE